MPFYPLKVNWLPYLLTMELVSRLYETFCFLAVTVGDQPTNGSLRPIRFAVGHATLVQRSQLVFFLAFYLVHVGLVSLPEVGHLLIW